MALPIVLTRSFFLCCGPSFAFPVAWLCVWEEAQEDWSKWIKIWDYSCQLLWDRVNIMCISITWSVGRHGKVSRFISFIQASFFQWKYNFIRTSTEIKFTAHLENRGLNLGLKIMSSATADLSCGHGTRKHRFLAVHWLIRQRETYPHLPKVGICGS